MTAQPTPGPRIQMTALRMVQSTNPLNAGDRFQLFQPLLASTSDSSGWGHLLFIRVLRVPLFGCLRDA